MKRFLRSIYGKISLIFLLLLITLGIVQFLLLLQFSTVFIAETDQKLNLNLARDLANKFKPFLEDTLDYGSIEHSFHEMMVMNPRVEFYLLDSAGTILAYFAEPEKIKRMSVDLAPIKTFLADDFEFNTPLYGDDPRSIERQKPISVTPIQIGQKKKGYLYVILGGEQYDSALAMVKESYMIRTSTMLLIVIFILTALIGLILFFFLTRRLRIVTQTVEKFKTGDYAARIQFKSNDEIGQLAEAYNKMADTINANLEEIQNNDRLRRELIANISHDLRSPLASVQGYLETILMKKENLTEDKKQEYLTIVHKNILRLNKLVYELFELSRLDAKQVQPEYESFSIAELAQDVILKFKPEAVDKNIDIQSNLPKNIALVEGDIGMIERALSNLLENAINFTPDQGQIRLDLQDKEKKITVRVRDTGAGINKQDLPHIFERFYRVDKSRSSKGTGLGLAITKKIVELHHSDIFVHSELNKGTTFEFDLPKTVIQ